MALDTDVLVVGAGPTGLMAADLLARAGIDHVVIDKRPGITDKTKALATQARSLELFDDLGFVDAAIERGQPVKGFTIVLGPDKRVSIDLEDIPSPYPFPLIIGQDENERLLSEDHRARGGEVRWGTELTELGQDDEKVTATVKVRGGDGTITARWLIGADGAHSPVRKAIGMPFEGRAYPESFVLADLDIEWENPGDRLIAHLRNGRLGIAFPLKARGSVRLVLLDPDPPPEGSPEAERDPTLDEVRALAERAIPYDFTVKDPRWTARFRSHARGVPRFRDGRVFLAGDAAHIHSPAGGQGMNTGLQDAYALVWRLAMVVRGDVDGPAAQRLLDSYHAERHPVAQRLLKTTDRFFQVSVGRNPITRLVREQVFPRLTRTHRFQDFVTRFISQVEIRYPRSPVVTDHTRRKKDIHGRHGRTPPQSRHRRHRTHGGGRAPDGMLRDLDGHDLRLFDLFRGTHHTLLAFLAEHDDPGIAGITDPTAPAQAVHDALLADIMPRTPWLKACLVSRAPVPEPPVERTPHDDEADARIRFLTDPNGTVHTHYGVPLTGSLVLVRPDGHIGYREDALMTSGLDAYLVDTYGS